MASKLKLAGESAPAECVHRTLNLGDNYYFRPLPEVCHSKGQ